MSDRYDAVVVGGGHNGLVAATLLAKAGREVVVLEAQESVGGLAAGREFHPGYRSVGVDHDDTLIRPWVIDKLGLTRFGLELESEETPVFSPAPAGGEPGSDHAGQAADRGLLLWRDPQRSREELGADAESYAAYRGFLERISPFARRTLDRVPVDVSEKRIADLWDLAKTGIGLRLLGKSDMMELFRIGPMCVADWLREWFRSDRLRALLAGPAVYGGFTGPWSPGTNTNLLLSEAFATPGVRGCAPAFVAALERAARDAGVGIRTGEPVESLEIDSGRVRGVVLRSGETIEAGLVAGACSPKHLLLDLVAGPHLSLRLEHGLTHYRTRGTTAKVHLALSGYPAFACRPDLRAERVRIAEGIDPLERAFDPVKYRRFGDELALDIRVPTVRAPELAPKGHQVFSVGVHFVPYALEGGWSQESRDRLLETVLRRIAAYAPEVRSMVVGSEVLSPADLEERFGVAGGQIHHGEHGLDQIFVRPTPECARYATPIRGLYLCGGGSYPGGGITGAPGALAAERILADPR